MVTTTGGRRTTAADTKDKKGTNGTRSAKSAKAAKAAKALTTTSTKGAKAGTGATTPAALIDARIEELGDWRGAMLARIRSLIKQAAPGVTEEWKWRGVPTWYRDGMICTGETYKTAVKVTFAKGAQLKDPSRLFNASLDGNVRRAIDLHDGDKLNETAFKALVREAVALNTAR